MRFAVFDLSLNALRHRGMIFLFLFRPTNSMGGDHGLTEVQSQAAVALSGV